MLNCYTSKLQVVHLNIKIKIKIILLNNGWNFTSGVPTYMASHYVYGAPLVDPLNNPAVMTTSLIRQQLDMKVYDIMYHVSQQLVDIIKLMFCNKVQIGK